MRGLNVHSSNEFISDEKLVFRASEGEDSAFALLLERYAPIIRQKASDFFRNGMDDEDFFQEGTLGLYSAVCSFKPEMGCSFKTYASVCINNRLISAEKAACRQKHMPLSNYVSLSQNGKASIFDLKYDLHQNPEEILISKEKIVGIYKYIKDLLSKSEYQVLTLYLSGCSYEKIALELNVSKKAVDNALARCRQKLRRAISE